MLVSVKGHYESTMCLCLLAVGGAPQSRTGYPAQEEEYGVCHCSLQAASLRKSAWPSPEMLGCVWRGWGWGEGLQLRGHHSHNTHAPGSPSCLPEALGLSLGPGPRKIFLFGCSPDAGEGLSGSKGNGTFPLEARVPVTSVWDLCHLSSTHTAQPASQPLEPLGSHPIQMIKINASGVIQRAEQ